MSETKLWCMHIQGPNEVHAAPDFWTALTWAAEMNTFIAQRASAENWAADDNWPLTQATVQRWPWPEEEHAVELAKELAERAAHLARRDAVAKATEDAPAPSLLREEV